MEELKKAIEESLSPIAKDIEGIKAEGKALNERLSKIEKLPAVERSFNINTIPSVYKGRKLEHMNLTLRKAVAERPQDFQSFIKPENIDGYTKFLIDLIGKTTLNETTDSQGGYNVPDEYQWDIIQLARNTSFALNVCRVLPMGSDTLKIPKELTHGAITWEAESAEKTASEPTFAQASLVAKKMFALAVTSNELLQDSAIDIPSLLTEQFAYGMGMELDNQIFNGTGSPVSGVLTAKAGYSVILTGTSFSTVSASDLSLAIAKLEEGRLGQARFFVNRMAMHYIRSLKDTNGRPIFAEIGATVPKTVYEYPINMTEKIATTDSASSPFGVFGNFQFLLIGRRLGAMAIEVDPYSKFISYQTQFRMVTRWGFDYGDVNCFVRILNHA